MQIVELIPKQCELKQFDKTYRYLATIYKNISIEIYACL